MRGCAACCWPHPQVEVVAEARNGREALELRAAHAPDALFLDVQMPEVDGLSVAASLPDPAPAIVFVTAFDHYALPAFDAAALDYLLKPADAEHVARAVQRLLHRGPAAAASGARPPPSQLVIPDRGRTWVVRGAARSSGSRRPTTTWWCTPARAHRCCAAR